VDLDAFIAEHRHEWERLRWLAGRPRRRLTAEQVDELAALYARAATHLSMVRSRAADPALIAWLSRRVMAARSALSPTPGASVAAVTRFFTVTFPGEVYRAWAWWVGVAALFIGLSGLRMAVVARDPLQFASQAYIDYYVEVAFESYYSTYQPQNFAFLVWTNNAYVSAVCLAAGVLILPVLLILWYNIENVGLGGGIMIANDRADVFFGLILVHGMLELTAIFIAAGVGLRIGWAWIAPGPDLTRGQAVAARARSGMVVALGLGVVLLVSGVVEAFVTPFALLPLWLRLTIGALVWLAFLGYVVVLGAYATRTGQDADVSPFDRPATVPTG
jgi:uncharacterized membrane protein SpoIIM required for sporulation